jgi:ankyrin repeat protein
MNWVLRYQDRTPRAAVSGSVEIVRMLVAAGAWVDVRTDEGRSPLDFAREKGHTQMAELLAGRQRSSQESRVRIRESRFSNQKSRAVHE